jgi:hypothetical protein
MKILYNNRSCVNYSKTSLKYDNSVIKIYIHNLRDLIVRDYIDECYIVSARDYSVYSEMTYKNSKYFHSLEEMEKS